MKIELHVIQNFGPANLNRDDTGSPKDCVFAGYRRARISSQCLKRAVREMYVHEDDVADSDLGMRTKRLAEKVAKVLEEKGIEAPLALGLTMATLQGVGLGAKSAKEDDRYMTQYLLFVPRRIAAEIAEVIVEHRESIEPLVELPTDDAEEEGNEKAKKKSAKDKKKAKKAAFPKAIGKEIQACLANARKTPDIALFGRMVADNPSWNVEAACQVAHAISTNRVTQEFDFYTAVDDLLPEGATGSDMMGTIPFNSSCFYRYAVLDVDALKENLGEDAPDGLLSGTIRGFVRGFVRAIPSGKQNSMAAHSLPSMAFAVVRKAGQPISLVNAFAKPAQPKKDVDGNELDLIDASIGSLLSYFDNIRGEYETDGTALLSWNDRQVDHEGIRRQPNLDALYASITEHALA